MTLPRVPRVRANLVVAEASFRVTTGRWYLIPHDRVKGDVNSFVGLKCTPKHVSAADFRVDMVKGWIWPALSFEPCYGGGMSYGLSVSKRVLPSPHWVCQVFPFEGYLGSASKIAPIQVPGKRGYCPTSAATIVWLRQPLVKDTVVDTTRPSELSKPQIPCATTFLLPRRPQLHSPATQSLPSSLLSLPGGSSLSTPFRFSRFPPFPGSS
jgi:hypothetical protein